MHAIALYTIAAGSIVISDRCVYIHMCTRSAHASIDPDISARARRRGGWPAPARTRKIRTYTIDRDRYRSRYIYISIAIELKRYSILTLPVYSLCRPQQPQLLALVMLACTMGPGTGRSGCEASPEIKTNPVVLHVHQHLMTQPSTAAWPPRQTQRAACCWRGSASQRTRQPGQCALRACCVCIRRCSHASRAPSL